MAMMSLREAVAAAIGRHGLELLQSPQRLVGYVSDIVDTDSREMAVLYHCCDRRLLDPFAQAVEEGPAGLGSAIERACDLLTSSYAIDAAVARTVATGLAEGISDALGWDASRVTPVAPTVAPPASYDSQPTQTVVSEPARSFVGRPQASPASIAGVAPLPAVSAPPPPRPQVPTSRLTPTPNDLSAMQTPSSYVNSTAAPTVRAAVAPAQVRRNDGTKRMRFVFAVLLVAVAVGIGLYAAARLGGLLPSGSSQANKEDTTQTGDTEQTQYTLELPLVIPGLDENGSRVPIRVKGATDTGVAIDGVMFADMQTRCISLEPGSYQISIAASPISAEGWLYEVPTGEVQIVMSSSPEGYRIDEGSDGYSLFNLSPYEKNDPHVYERAVEYLKLDPLCADRTTTLIDAASRTYGI